MLLGLKIWTTNPSGIVPHSSVQLLYTCYWAETHSAVPKATMRMTAKASN